ncbi:restriction endonuclease subunit S, partial [Campylobacter helveticus]
CGSSPHPEWQSFKIGELFEVVGTKSLDENKIQFVDEGINFVGRVNQNNGVKGKIAKQNFEPNVENTITATVIGQYKYVKLQKEPYYCSQNINKLTPKFENKNKFVMYFFISYIQKFVSIFDGQQAGYKLEDLKNHIILLPITNNKIDFDFMQSFIKAIQKECIKSVVLWQEKQKKAYEKVVKKL